MNYSTAQSLADSTLAAFKLDIVHGKLTPDATTTVFKTLYNGPKGRGWEVRVVLKGKVNDLVVVRHFGPEAHRAKPDLTLATAKEQALTTLAKQPERVLSLTAVNAATTIDGLLFDATLALNEAKLIARAKAKTARDALLAAGFSYSGKTIQTRNQTDIDNINGAALRATNDATFTTGWIAADNTVLPLDAAGVIAMQAAMITRGNAIFGAYIALTAQIEAAATIEEVNALPALSV